MVGWRSTKVYRCTWDIDARNGSTNCHVAANAKLANGINKSPDGEILVVDLLAKSVLVFDQLDDSLKLKETVKLNNPVDNIEYDPSTDAFYMGSIKSLQQLNAVIDDVKNGTSLKNNTKSKAAGGV